MTPISCTKLRPIRRQRVLWWHSSRQQWYIGYYCGEQEMDYPGFFTSNNLMAYVDDGVVTHWMYEPPSPQELKQEQRESGMREHTFFGKYCWVSFSTARTAHAVWAWDDEIEERALCGSGGTYQEWDDPGDKPRCPKCAKRMKVLEQEKSR